MIKAQIFATSSITVCIIVQCNGSITVWQHKLEIILAVSIGEPISEMEVPKPLQLLIFIIYRSAPIPLFMVEDK